MTCLLCEVRLRHLARVRSRVFRFGPQPVFKYRLVVLTKSGRRTNASLRSAVESDAKSDLGNVVTTRRTNAIEKQSGEQLLVLGDLVESIDGSRGHPRF